MSVGEDVAVDRKHQRIADVVAGISVAMVLIPQCLAYAELAGMPAHYGLYASALPPLLAAYFASSPYLQTGPVALTSLLAFAALSAVGAPGSAVYLGAAAVLAVLVGAWRVLIGALRGGSISYLMSLPVLRGFTAAAALLILASQLPKALGYVPESDDVLRGAVLSVIGVVHWEPTSLLLSAMTLAFMFGGKRIHPLFPGVLAAVVVGTAFSALTHYSGSVVGQIPSALLPPVTVLLPWTEVPRLLVPGLIIALVGFAEAASVAQTYAEQSRKEWDPNREFIGQGVANLAAGFSGAFPVGGSFSRSAVNKLAGAQTRLAGAVTGLTVLLFLPFAWILAPLPKAVLGAIVVGAVLKLLDPRPILILFKQSKPQALIGVSTFVMTLLFSPDVQWAVVAGIGLSIGLHLYREQQCSVASTLVDDVLWLRPAGVIWFGSAPMYRQAMSAEIGKHRNASQIVVDLANVGRIDLTGALALRELREALPTGVTLRFDNVPEFAERIINRVGLSKPA